MFDFIQGRMFVTQATENMYFSTYERKRIDVLMSSVESQPIITFTSKYNVGNN